ncbi:hypothetical protein D9M73_65140 [compost metagenome]
MTAALANGGASDKRRALDFYPTPPEATQALLGFWCLPPCVIWEPACGDGAMSKVLEQRGYRVVSTDLRETGFGQGGIDFLAAAPRECDAIVTNPPFNLSEAFIRRALSVTPCVAMLLKSQYWHAAKRFQLFDDCPPSFILPLTWRPDFMNGERGGAPTMDVLWSVWTPGGNQTIYRPLPRPARAANAIFAEAA